MIRVTTKFWKWGFLAGLAMLAIAGCASEPLERELGPEETYDGLREVTNARVGKAWIRPDLDLTGYNRILPIAAGVEYSPAAAGSRNRTSGRSGFPVSAETREKFQALVSEVFRDELSKSERFQLTTEPGPDVLVVIGGLINVVSNVPPEPAGRGNVYLTRVGEATLVLELRDSESNAVLARVVDRRAAEKRTGTNWSNSVSNAADVRRLVRFWASRLREALDAVPSLTAADD